MQTKGLYTFAFLNLMNSQNLTAARRRFSTFIYTLFSYRNHQAQTNGLGRGIFNLNNHTMKQNKGNWRHSVSISKLPKMLLFGILLTASSFSFSQTNGNSAASFARMTLDNNVAIRSGLNAVYEIAIPHFGFESVQAANAYFQARDVDYIDFVVIDAQTVQLHLDLNNPAVANWTISEWNQALATRANTFPARTLPTNN